MLTQGAKRWFVPIVLLVWAGFTAWCVCGFPPAVDLPADGAQIETLKNLLRGDPEVKRYFQIQYVVGYGLPFWVFLPIAFIWNGGVAARLALWVCLQLFPLSHLAMLRAFRRSEWAMLLGLPLAFNFSYWYGLMPGLFAQPLAFFSAALFARTLEAPSWKRIGLLNLLAGATLLCHLVAFAVLAVVIAALALSTRPLKKSVQMALGGLLLPIGLSLVKVIPMAQRALTPGPWPATEFAGSSHLTWFFHSYRPEGALAIIGPLLVAAVFCIAYLRRRKVEPAGPAAMFAAALGLYLLTPKTLSGIFLISVRLPVFAGMLSLLLVSAEVLPRQLRAGLAILSVASLVETGVFHWRFAREVDGLEQMLAGPVRSPQGYWSLAGPRLLGSKHIYAEHLGQWLTATRGGVGHNFFADAQHHPVHFKPGVDIPARLDQATPQQLAWFQEILIYGDGALPSWLNGWREEARAGRWRKLVPIRISAQPQTQRKPRGVPTLLPVNVAPSEYSGRYM